MQTRNLGNHAFCFNPEANGGESLILKTSFLSSDLRGIFTNQEFSLNSYGNSSSFTLCGAVITPKQLRELANQLESFEIQAKYRLEEEKKLLETQLMN